MFEFVAGFGLIAWLITVLVFIFWIWMLVDCLQNPRLQGTEKLIWVLVIIFLHGLGALIYFFVGREHGI